jgi:cell division protein ZapA (FtsZ GTPase activity inhibitor)
MADELIPLNIVIGDRNYRIKSLAKDEEVIRNSVKTINDKIVEFKTQFAGKDMQDYIAMVMIWYATTLAEKDGEHAMGKEVNDMLEKLEQQLDKALQ